MVIRRAHGIEDKPQGAALVEADDDEIIYEITFDLPDAGLVPPGPPDLLPLGDNRNDTAEPAVIPQDIEEGRRNPQRACRSVIGNQPYDTYAPRTTFLQLSTVHAHRSVSKANQLARMTRHKRMMATTTCTPEDFIDDAVHKTDTALLTSSEAELSIWGYMMTQYNLKPGLLKLGNKGEKAAMKELTSLHVMDTWKPMDAAKLSREQRMRALSSLLFLWKNEQETSRDEHALTVCLNEPTSPRRTWHRRPYQPSRLSSQRPLPHTSNARYAATMYPAHL